MTTDPNRILNRLLALIREVKNSHEESSAFLHVKPLTEEQFRAKFHEIVDLAVKEVFSVEKS